MFVVEEAVKERGHFSSIYSSTVDYDLPATPSLTFPTNTQPSTMMCLDVTVREDGSFEGEESVSFEFTSVDATISMIISLMVQEEEGKIKSTLSVTSKNSF